MVVKLVLWSAFFSKTNPIIQLEFRNFHTYVNIFLLAPSEKRGSAEG